MPTVYTWIKHYCWPFGKANWTQYWIFIEYFPSWHFKSTLLLACWWLSSLRIEGGVGIWNAKMVTLMTSMFVFFCVFLFGFVLFCFFYPLQVGFSHSTSVNAVLLGNFHFYLGFCSLWSASSCLKSVFGCGRRKWSAAMFTSFDQWDRIMKRTCTHNLLFLFFSVSSSASSSSAVLIGFAKRKHIIWNKLLPLHSRLHGVDHWM